jgi:hypothetical protein
MAVRGSDALRWTLPLPLESALPFLIEIGWPGDIHQTEHLLTAACAWTTHVGLSLNVGEQIGPYLGLEFLNWTKPLASPAAWRECLETLVRWNLCLPEKARALLDYPGIRHERGDQWSPSLRTSDDYQEQVVRFLRRGLLHIKLTLSSSASPTAKAYLEVVHGWMDRPSFRRKTKSPLLSTSLEESQG